MKRKIEPTLIAPDLPEIPAWIVEASKHYLEIGEQFHIRRVGQMNTNGMMTEAQVVQKIVELESEYDADYHDPYIESEIRTYRNVLGRDLTEEENAPIEEAHQKRWDELEKELSSEENE